ncbi:hypothetical protein CNR22_19265 [Sphingobacteriaceae bacterium]|nr:hypothetical protein CNR22_19265 [Sphingobacteriaceae bacterium]
MVKHNSSSKKAASQLKKLNFLIGVWHTSGRILNAPSASANTIRGMDSYEWVSSGAFILHRVDVFMGEERTEAVEIIGYDENRKSYFMKSFDSQGASLLMYATSEKPGVLVFGDKKMRATLKAGKASQSMKAIWEISENGKTWQPWMTLQLDK